MALSVSGLRPSSVTTSRVTGDDKVREFTGVDLAMKLHYVKVVYFFRCDAVRGIDIYALKKPMFELLDLYNPAAGRIRRTGTGRPMIKCNDSGVRIVEAQCGMSVDEWLGSKDRDADDQLVPSKVIGPELEFSPLLYIQFTWFTCGGLSVGLNLAHILGDSFSALEFINNWAQNMGQGPVPRQHVQRQPFSETNTRNYQNTPASVSAKPLSLKMIDSVRDTWQIPSTPTKMETYSFHVGEKVLQKAEKQETFPFLTALFWKAISQIRKLEIKIVTICNNGSKQMKNEILENSQTIGAIEVDFSIRESSLSDLAKWVEEKTIDERNVIEGYVEKNREKSDFILYGANLTFVNLEGANVHGLEIRGKKAIFASLTVAGVGEEGAVLVFPVVDGERMVTVILPENEISELKNVMAKEWRIY